MRNAYSWQEAESWYAIETARVVARVTSPQLVRVPLAPAWLRGAYNELGRTVPVVDVAMLVGARSEGLEVQTILLVAAPGGELGVACGGTVVERLVSRPRGFDRVFERPSEGEEVRMISIDRLLQAIEAALEVRP